MNPEHDVFVARADRDDDLLRCASWCGARRWARARWTLVELLMRRDDPRRLIRQWLTGLAERWHAVVVVSVGLASGLPQIWRHGFSADSPIGWSVEDLQRLEGPAVGILFDWRGAALPDEVRQELVAMAPSWVQLSIRMAASDGLQTISNVADAVTHVLTARTSISYRAATVGPGDVAGASVLALVMEEDDDDDTVGR